MKHTIAPENTVKYLHEIQAERVWNFIKYRIVCVGTFQHWSRNCSAAAEGRITNNNNNRNQSLHSGP